MLLSLKKAINIQRGEMDLTPCPENKMTIFQTEIKLQTPKAFCCLKDLDSEKTVNKSIEQMRIPSFIIESSNYIYSSVKKPGFYYKKEGIFYNKIGISTDKAKILNFSYSSQRIRHHATLTEEENTTEEVSIQMRKVLSHTNWKPLLSLVKFESNEPSPKSCPSLSTKAEPIKGNNFLRKEIIFKDDLVGSTPSDDSRIRRRAPVFDFLDD